MKGTQECGFFFFFFFVCSERVRGNGGEKSQLEAWKTVTLHSGSCNILTTKMKQEGEKSKERGRLRNKGRGERALRGINEREGDLDAEKMELNCARMSCRSHTQSSRAPLFSCCEHTDNEGGGVRAGHRAPDSTINRDSSIHIHSTATAFSRYTFTHGFSSPGQRGKCMCRDRPVGRWRGQ